MCSGSRGCRYTFWFDVRIVIRQATESTARAMMVRPSSS